MPSLRDRTEQTPALAEIGGHEVQAMSTKVQHYLEEKLVWRHSGDPLYPYDAEFNGERCVLRLNAFPDDHLYTLLVDEEEVASFDDWPERWQRPERFQTRVIHAGEDQAE